MNYYKQERFGGLLLPFLAGVAVTTPFVFFAKNQQQPYYPQPYPYPPPPPYMYPNPYMTPVYYR